MLTVDLRAAASEQDTWSRAAGVETCQNYNAPSHLFANGVAAETTGLPMAAEQGNEFQYMQR